MITLKIGDVAPEFSAINQDGKMINLTDYKGKKLVPCYKNKAMKYLASAKILRNHIKNLSKSKHCLSI